MLVYFLKQKDCKNKPKTCTKQKRLEENFCFVSPVENEEDVNFLERTKVFVNLPSNNSESLGKKEWIVFSECQTQLGTLSILRKKAPYAFSKENVL